METLELIERQTINYETMNIGAIIKKAIEKRIEESPYLGGEPLTWERVAKEIGTSKSNLYYMFRQESIQTKFYKELCDKVLDIPYGYLLELSDKHEMPLSLKDARKREHRNIDVIEKLGSRNSRLSEKIKDMEEEMRREKAVLESRIKGLETELDDKNKIIKLYESQIK